VVTEVIDGSGWFVPTWVAVASLACIAWWAGAFFRGKK
jgi:hypothetical protein